MSTAVPTDHTTSGLVTASASDTAAVVGGAIAPILAQGVIARRPPVVRLAGLLRTDDRSVRMLSGIRDRYGSGPVRLALPGRSVALVLDDVHRVLDGTPEPFAAATWEKRGALGQFQPHGVLVSHGAARAERRRFTETVLDTGAPMHAHAETITRIAREEMLYVREQAAHAGLLDWDAFVAAWWRIVRRVVLGDRARSDHALTDLLTRMRRRGNLSVLAPKRDDLRESWRRGVRQYLEQPQPGSLAEMIAETEQPGDAPEDQVGHWMFAFDPGAAVTLRALALLAADPTLRGRVRAETAGRDLDRPHELPLLRSTVLESARLWPTTPLLLRETTRVTEWSGGELPAGTALLVPAWFLHRDPRTRDDADRADPDQWLDGRARDDWMLTPFSGGPGVCPGRELVLFIASTVLASLIEDHHHVLLPPERFDTDDPLPRGLDPYALRFGVSRAAATPSTVRPQPSGP